MSDRRVALRRDSDRVRRVLVVTHAGGSPYHGPNMRWFYLGRALKAFGVEVEIVSSSHFHKYIDPPDVHQRMESDWVDGVAYHWIRTRPYEARGWQQVWNQLEFVWGCYRELGTLAAAKPDVVIASSPHPLVTFPAVRLARKAGARFVFDVRDLWPEILFELGGFGRLHPYALLLRAAERRGVAAASKVISVKPGDQEYFAERYGLAAERFAYVPNGHIPGGCEAVAPEELDRLRRQYRYLVGYVGGISTYYSLEDLVELARHFADRPDVAFVIVGKGDRKECVERKAEALGLEHVYFLGAVARAAVPAVLDQFDICYVGLRKLAIHRYGISCNKIHEYMAAGKPILGSYEAGYDPVRAADCGKVRAPGDTEALADALQVMLDDSGLRLEMSRNAHSYFAANHDFRTIARHLRDELFAPAV